MNEAELAFCEILDCDRISLYLNRDSCLSRDVSAALAAVLKRRAAGEPIQYILGKAEFFGLQFILTPDVLIPRPESEVLAEAVVKYAYRLSPIANRILEIGTGSGCIAISLAKLLPNVEITATDISEKALGVALENSRIHQVSDRIKFLQSNLFRSSKISDKRFAICVFNPPYIPSSQIERLQPELRYEPRIALDGGIDGLDFYRRTIKEAADYLATGGLLIMEIGYNQQEAVGDIFKRSLSFEIIEFVRDYNNRDRVVIAKKAAKRWIN